MGVRYVYELPWPPSVNHYWRMVKGRMLISREGRDYRTAVARALGEAGAVRLEGRLEVQVDAWPPDRRRRDLDNLCKALLDALEHGGAYRDDGQIDRLTVIRRPVVAGGALRVSMEGKANP